MVFRARKARSTPSPWSIDFNAHTLVDGDVAPIRPSSSTVVVTSLRCGTLEDRHRIVSEQRGRKNRKRGVFRA